MNREKWYEVTFFTNKPKEATERLDTNFVGKIDNLKVTEIKSQIEPMNREKLEAEIQNLVRHDESCGANFHRECNCPAKTRTSQILTAIDAYLKEEKHKSWLEGKEDTIRLMRSGVELDKAIKSHKLKSGTRVTNSVKKV